MDATYIEYRSQVLTTNPQFREIHMNTATEPAYGDYTVVYDHYAAIPMQEGYIITDAPSLVRTTEA